ncbi:MAG: hypothetical protein ABSC15_20985 [Terriglobales bacterium]|jgi:hypothetical protein
MTKHVLINPDTNKLPDGIAEPDVCGAITKSGYPLQNIVAGYCEKAGFRAIEEWSYLDNDKDAEQLRTIDVKAEKQLFEYQQGSETKIRPSLVLLIECKQSQLPYVFFLSQHPVRISHFPVFAGLHHGEIAIKTDDDLSTYNVGILGALGLGSHSFLAEGPEFCSSFSKCVRKGKGLELSGSDPFLSLVSPLVKALQHFQRAVEPPKTALYFDLYLTLALAVIDGPMVGVRVQEKSNELVFLPWVRIVRHEYSADSGWWERGRAFAVDVVHKDFLQAYVEKNAEAFAVEFSGLAIKHHKVLASGKGFVSGMGKNASGDLEKRLNPR